MSHLVDERDAVMKLLDRLYLANDSQGSFAAGGCSSTMTRAIRSSAQLIERLAS
mgnify:CR=1 FL=1